VVEGVLHRYLDGLFDAARLEAERVEIVDLVTNPPGLRS